MDLGLGTYDAFFRNLDPQIGRWWQIDPKIEWDMESWSPYASNFNNPIKFDDPKGDCPSCIIGFFVGAAAEYTTQVATNLIQGKSFGKSLIDIDKNAIGISAVTGAATSGISAFVPKSAAAKLVVAGVNTTIDAAESAAKQYNETGSVSLSTTVTDVVINKSLSKVTENINFYSSSSIKTTEMQLNRAERVAAGYPNSSGRANAVNTLQDKLANQKNANAASQQAVGNIVTNGVQGVVNTIIQPVIIQPSAKPVADNTLLRKPLQIIRQ